MITIIFVIDGLALEAHAALLAASLVHHNADRFRYVGYVPQRHAAALSPALQTLMQRCGVELRALPDPTHPWAKPYPHGNKILAALDPRATSHTMFLDTDIICTGPLALDGLTEPGTVALVPEGRRTWGADLSRWERVYAHFGYDMPTDRVALTRRKNLFFVPYFNAGMILFPNDPIQDGLRFADLWYGTALIIDHIVPVAKKRPWLDQIALPLALKRAGLRYVLADERLNFSGADRAPQSGDDPLLLHYHRFGHLANWPDHRAAALNATRTMAGEALYADLSTLYDQFWSALPMATKDVGEDAGED